MPQRVNFQVHITHITNVWFFGTYVGPPQLQFIESIQEVLDWIIMCLYIILIEVELYFIFTMSQGNGADPLWRCLAFLASRPACSLPSLSPSATTTHVPECLAPHPHPSMQSTGVCWLRALGVYWPGPGDLETELRHTARTLGPLDWQKYAPLILSMQYFRFVFVFYWP